MKGKKEENSTQILHNSYSRKKPMYGLRGHAVGGDRKKTKWFRPLVLMVKTERVERIATLNPVTGKQKTDVWQSLDTWGGHFLKSPRFKRGRSTLISFEGRRTEEKGKIEKQGSRKREKWTGGT